MKQTKTFINVVNAYVIQDWICLELGDSPVSLYPHQMVWGLLDH